MQYQEAHIMNFEACRSSFDDLKFGKDLDDLNTYHRINIGLNDKIVCTDNTRGRGLCIGRFKFSMQLNASRLSTDFTCY